MVVNKLNSGLIDRRATDKKITTLINDEKDKIVVNLLLTVRTMVDALLKTNQLKNVEEFELCSRHLQPLFQKLFDHSEGSFLFKWTNTLPLADESSGRNRPDGLAESDRKGFQVKSVKFVKDHRRINMFMFVCEKSDETPQPEARIFCYGNRYKRPVLY